MSDLDARRDELLQWCERLGLDPTHIKDGTLRIEMDGRGSAYVTWEGCMAISEDLAKEIIWGNS